MALSPPQLPYLNKDPDTLREALSAFFDEFVTAFNNLLPPGSVVAFAGVAIPEGWLECNGDSYDQETYKDLAKALAQYDGSGGTFQVPDYQEKVLFGQSATYPLDTEEGFFGSAGNIAGKAIYYIIKV